MRKPLLISIACVVLAAPQGLADCSTTVSCAASAARSEVSRYARDAKSLALAPLQWDHRSWERFGAGVATVAALYVADQKLIDRVQANRSSSGDRFAKTITPFGGHRALEMSVAMLIAGAASQHANLRDAGRDSLESELIAAGVVTPLLKFAFGRARPIQGQGSHSFHPFDTHYESFPSGHATNAFAFATAVASHYDSWVVPTIVYTMAGGVAFARVNHNVHFPSDVVAGALIGRAVAKGITSRHTRGGAAWSLVPVFEGKNRGLQLAFSR